MATCQRLQGRRWDAVIDTCGYVPGSVSRVMDALDRDRVAHYTFVSSVSVYADRPASGSDESAPVATITPEQLNEAEADGDRRARDCPDVRRDVWCVESVVRAGGRADDARQGAEREAGPDCRAAYDYSDRFTYWVRRVREGGEVLAPGRPERRVRVIDARDLAEWLIRMAECGRQASSMRPAPKMD